MPEYLQDEPFSTLASFPTVNSLTMIVNRLWPFTEQIMWTYCFYYEILSGSAINLREEAFDDYYIFPYPVSSRIAVERGEGGLHIRKFLSDG